MSHLKLKTREKLEGENWTVNGSGGGNRDFNFHARSGNTRFRIYCWLVPNPDNLFYRKLEEDGETVTTIKLLRVGYLVDESQ